MGLTLLSRQNALASAQVQQEQLASTETVPAFEEKLAAADLFPLHATGISVLQVNVGKFCNQT